jgi:hypothetical protein
MADHIRRQVRDAAVAALTGLATTGSRVFASRIYPLQDAELPGLLVYTQNEDAARAELGGLLFERTLELVIEGHVKAADGFDDTADAIAKEAEAALAANQGIGGAKYVHLRRTEVEFDAQAEQGAARIRLTFEVLYYTTLGSPDVAL